MIFVTSTAVVITVLASMVEASYKYSKYPVTAAVISKHHVTQYNVGSSGHRTPIIVNVPSHHVPVNFIFRSASSPINVQQKHQGTSGSYKESYSRDEPHKLMHTVTKPIIQEIREIIMPFRRITQTVEPVREEIRTNVARNSGINMGAAGSLSGNGNSGGSDKNGHGY